MKPYRDTAKKGDMPEDQEESKEQEKPTKTAVVSSNIQVSVPKSKDGESKKVKEAMEEVKDAVKDLKDISEEPRKSIRDVVSKSTTTIPDLEKQVTKIAEKVPIIDALEGKIHQINKLSPKLKKLSSDLNDLGDFSDFEAAKVGGETIKHIYDASKIANPIVKERLMDTAQAVGQMKLNAIYAREQAKKEEPSKDEIYKKVFDVMNSKGLVGALNQENMQKSSKSDEEIKAEVAPSVSLTTKEEVPVKSDGLTTKAEFSEVVAAPATPVQTESAPKVATVPALDEVPKLVVTKKTDQELTGGFATKEPVIFSTPSSEDALKSDMARRIRNDVASLEDQEKKKQLAKEQREAHIVNEALGYAKDHGVALG